MRIAQVIGTVTLNRVHPALAGLRLKLAIPVNLEELAEGLEPAGEPLVVVDELGAGIDDLIAVSESMEAAAPFRPAEKPVDAYNAAILDQLDLEF